MQNHFNNSELLAAWKKDKRLVIANYEMGSSRNQVLNLLRPHSTPSKENILRSIVLIASRRGQASLRHVEMFKERGKRTSRATLTDDSSR